MAARDENVAHGSVAMYMRHYRKGEKACEKCLKAWSVYTQKAKKRMTGERMKWEDEQ